MGVFFHHATGIYQYDIYGLVKEVSRPVIDFIRAIPANQYSSVAGWLEADGDHISWAIGTVTVRGVTYTNCELRFTISSQLWTHYSKPTQAVTSLRRQPLYTDGTTQFALVGDTAGNVLKVNTGTDDFGTPLYYSLIHAWDKVDGLLSTRKTLQTGNFIHTGGAESTVAYQTETQDPDDLNNWSRKIGQLKTINTGFNSMNIKGRKVRIRLFGTSKGQPFVYQGYELIEPINEFIQFT